MILSLLAAAFGYVPLASCGSTGTHWSALPVEYSLTVPSGSTAYSELSDAEVLAAIQGGWAQWSQTTSCCSDFTSTYLGTTTAHLNLQDDEPIVEFEENNWDPSYGSQNVTIAITLVSYSQTDCRIFAADQVYNGVGFHFTVDPNAGGTDLQSIATHENGHWLGLNHSSIGGATMFASYSGGIGPRTLHPDDESGVCDLYPGSCGPAEDDCSDGIDNDGDGAIDCDDNNCANFSGCTCPVTGVVGCDNSVTGTTVGATSTVDTWSCTEYPMTGPEATYTFVPSEDGPITVTMSGLSADLDLFITTEQTGGCEPSVCLGSSNAGGTSNESLSFPGSAGVVYAVVVDGFDGAQGDFTLATDCPNPQGGGSCEPTAELSCGGSIASSNFGAENNVQAFSCAGWETTGPEVVYSLRPAAGPVTIGLTGLSADLDLFVTEAVSGECAESACVAVSGENNSDSENLTFEADGSTTYMVVADGWDGASSDFVLTADCTQGTPADTDLPDDTDPGVLSNDVDLKEFCGCSSSGGSVVWMWPLLLLWVQRRAVR